MTNKLISLFLTLILAANALAQTPEVKVRQKNNATKTKKANTLAPGEQSSLIDALTDLAVTRVPFLTQDNLRQGRADTAQVAQVIFNNKIWNFRYDPTSNAVDDSATVIVAGSRRYVIVADNITPQMFGVTNNSTDESSKLKKAFQAAINRKKPLYMPEATYVGYVSFSNINGLKIYGSGPGTIWKLPNGTNQTIFKCKTCSNISITDMTFDGNAANNPTRQVSDAGENNVNDNIYISRGVNNRVERTVHYNSTGNGVNFYKAVAFHIDYNYFKDCNRLDQNHVTVQFGFTDETVDDNGGSVSYNEFDGNPTGFGMSCFSGHEMIVTGNIARNCLVGVAAEYGGSKNTLTYNKTFDCGKGAVVTSTADFGRRGDYNIVSNNQFLRCTSTGTGMVQLSGQNHLKFHTNIITGAAGNTNSGIYGQVIRDSELYSNEIFGMGSDGIFFPTGSLTSQRNKVHDNVSYSNGGNGYYFVANDRLEFYNNTGYNNITSGAKFQLCTRLVTRDGFYFDNQTTATQQYGMILQDNTDAEEDDNTFSFNLNQPDVNIQGTNTRHHIGKRINMQRSRSSTVPSSGSWGVGDIVTNSVPVKGKPTGWKCITAGTPGTWEIMSIYGNTLLRVTATERAALTPSEGDIVFQTDGTKGAYQYLSGAWVAL
ncbi:hypothetical protein [Pedobacter sp.]|uniref:hypothetical protein n=1 Tax=Pedobacter sp. TaxID=1411316 RepID=UPI003C695591